MQQRDQPRKSKIVSYACLVFGVLISLGIYLLVADVKQASLLDAPTGRPGAVNLQRGFCDELWAPWLCEQPSLKVFTKVKPEWGKAFPRIHHAFEDYKPDWVRFVDTPEEADVQIVHFLGKGELKDVVGPNSVIIQHVTECDLDQEDLLQLWSSALLTISFHDLDRMVGVHAPERHHQIRTWSMPWGVDTSRFTYKGGKVKKQEADQRYAIITGELAETESHREVVQATAAVGDMQLFHTGFGDSLEQYCRSRDRPWPQKHCDRYHHLSFQSDEDFARLLREATWVPVLRRDEGFEMMGVEALFSGTRPIAFDLENVTQPYRWFKGHAALVRQGPMARDEEVANSSVVQELIRIMRQPPPAISKQEISELTRKFAWGSIIPGMYRNIWIELQRRRRHSPQPLPPRLAVSMVPEPSWLDDARKLYGSCSTSSADALGWDGQPDPTGCPEVVVLLDHNDRTLDNCQDAALFAAKLHGQILTPKALSSWGHPACSSTTLLLLTPDPPKDALSHLHFKTKTPHPAVPQPPMKNTVQLMLLHPTLSSRPPPANSSTEKDTTNAMSLMKSAVVVLRRRGGSKDPPLRGNPLKQQLQVPLRLASIDPRDPRTTPTPNYAEFVLVAAPGSEAQAEAIILFWAANPTYPLLKVATPPKNTLLHDVHSYRTDALAVTYNVTNIVHVPSANLTPDSLPSLLSSGIHIHTAPPASPSHTHPTTHPHLANLARSAGALLVVPTSNPAYSQFVSDSSWGHAVPQAVAYGQHQLLEAVKKVAEMPVWQRMLIGQEGQRRYLQDLQEWEGIVDGLRHRVRSFAAEGCFKCKSSLWARRMLQWWPGQQQA